MDNNFVFEDTSTINDKKVERIARAAVELEEALSLADDSNKVISLKTHRQTVYFKTLSDAHMPKSNMYDLIEEIITYGKVPGMLLEIGGDALNNSIKNSVGDTHGEVLTPQNAIKLFARMLKKRAAEEGIDLFQLIVAIRSGNHENRTYKDVAMDPAYMLAVELGMEDRYVKNIAKIEIQVLNEKEELLTKHVIVATHGEKKPGKAGAQAESGIASNLDYGADLVVFEHNHRIAAGSQNVVYESPYNSKPSIKKQTTYVNFGAYIEGEEYADRASYTFPRKSDKEIVRISYTDGKKTYDLINFRSMVNANAEENIKDLEYSLKTLEQGSYGTKNEIKKAYAILAKSYLKTELKKHGNHIKEKAKRTKDSVLGENIFFAPLSGLKIGSPDAKVDEIMQAVAVLSKLNGSCKVALSDVIFYKKAFTLVNRNGGLLGEKFPEDTFSYIEQAAGILKPIKDKIFMMNSGIDERKIMAYQSEALAKMAMTRLQMPESLCYLPYTKEQLLAEQLKIQANQVEAFNKSALQKAVSNALRDVKAAIAEALPYKIENYKELSFEERDAILEQKMKTYERLSKENEKQGTQDNEDDDDYEEDDFDDIDEKMDSDDSEKRKVNKKEAKHTHIDYLKDIISAKLRHDGEFISLAQDRDYVNFIYPLEEIELRTPHPFLIQNILCALLEIDPKNIVINTNTKKAVNSVCKLKDDKGKTRTIQFHGGYSSSTAGRSSIDTSLKGALSSSPGSHVYFTNTKLGKEFIMLEKQIFENPFTNQSEKKDTIFISGGTFDPETEISVNKIYKLFAIDKKQKQEISTGMYTNLSEPFRLYCESLNYATALFDKDILEAIFKKSVARSYAKTVTKFNAKQTKEFIDNSLDEMSFLNDEDNSAKPKAKNSKDAEMQ